MDQIRSILILDDADQHLVLAARNVAKNAYAPYSGFAVGAAARAKSGAIFSGTNLENSVYGLGMCAEVAAITAANSSGQYDLEAIAVVGYKFIEPNEYSEVVAPCGRCRQLILEAAQISNIDITVFSCSGDLKRILRSTISELLPNAFGPKNLGLNSTWADKRRRLASTTADLSPQVPDPRAGVRSKHN
jgi:cytidine deaminase